MGQFTSKNAKEWEWNPCKEEQFELSLDESLTDVETWRPQHPKQMKETA